MHIDEDRYNYAILGAMSQFEKAMFVAYIEHLRNGGDTVWQIEATVEYRARSARHAEKRRETRAAKSKRRQDRRQQRRNAGELTDPKRNRDRSSRP